MGVSAEIVFVLMFHLIGLSISSEDNAVPVPLQGVAIDAKIVDFISEITVTQSYVNVESNPIEVIYMFPIEEEAGVTSFEAEIDNHTIVTEIREIDRARDEYHDAIRNSKTAVLLEETQPDIFQIKLGQLKPGATANIKIKYLTELIVEDGNIKLTIPTTIAPRYIPYNDNSDAAKKIAYIPYSLSTPAPLTIAFNGIMQTKIKSVKSPSNGFQITLPDSINNKGQYTFKGGLSAKTTDLDKDVILYVEASDDDEMNKPIVFFEKPSHEKTNQGIVAMLSLVPSFKLEDQPVELIFLVDRSGSMSGSSIVQAKQALNLFLHSLPPDCYFNIWSFGSSFDALFKSRSEKYSDHTLNTALQHVASMDADYGGTEIYQLLDAIFKQPKPACGYIRQIFVLTDGEVSNAPSVISLVKENDSHGRIFSLGLGSSASRYLVKGIARAGSGTSIFASEREDLRTKVMSQLKNAIQPALSNVQIYWKDNAPSQTYYNMAVELVKEKTLLGYMKPKKKPKKEDTRDNEICTHLVGQVPCKVPAIFDGTRLLAYHVYDKEDSIPKQIEITALSPDGPLSVVVEVKDANMLEAGNFVHQLAGRKKIQELQETISSLSLIHI